MTGVAALTQEILPSIVALRHELHAHPELGYEERETADRLLRRLETVRGLQIRTGVARTGVVATLNAHMAGPCVALRADMDALPIQEETALPYSSEVAGRMHACGHDGHMSCLVGAALVLARMADELPGKVKFIFQPAEEGGGGAPAMCNEGVLDDPRVDAIFALHGWPGVDLGSVELSAGPTMASSDRWTMTIDGTGTHAAFPHQGVDPIVVAAQVVTALQTIASRTIDPLEPVVVTVGQFHAGTASNIIPDQAVLEGTMRTLSGGVREQVKARIEQIARQTAEAYGARAEVSFHNRYPVTMNDAAGVQMVAEVARSIVGTEHVSVEARPSMGSEDFSFFAEKVPAVYWRLGVRRPGEARSPALHQPTYEFPDAALPIGIRMHCGIVRAFLRSGLR